MLQALDHFDGHCGLAPVCQCLHCIREPKTSPGTPGCPRGAEQREIINSFSLLATLLVKQPSLQLFLNCRLLKPMELLCCGRPWGAGAARWGVLCLSLALGTRWDGAEDPHCARFLLCACSATGLLVQVVMALQLGLTGGTVGLPSALGKVRWS